MQILGLLGMYFDAAVVEVKTFSLLFRLALAILCIASSHVERSFTCSISGGLHQFWKTYSFISILKLTCFCTLIHSWNLNSNKEFIWAFFPYLLPEKFSFFCCLECNCNKRNGIFLISYVEKGYLTWNKLSERKSFWKLPSAQWND